MKIEKIQNKSEKGDIMNVFKTKDKYEVGDKIRWESENKTFVKNIPNPIKTKHMGTVIDIEDNGNLVVQMIDDKIKLVKPELVFHYIK